MSKKIKIVGAGIAGLSVGCYLQMNGYETEIFEQHRIPGGLCTSWKQSDYCFDGCVHWLLGSDNGSAFYKLWSELIDMEDMDFINHDKRVTIELKNHVDKYGNKDFILYSDIQVLEKYLLDIAPEDEIPIKSFIQSIKKLQKYEIPPLIEKAPELRTFLDKLKLLKFLPLLIFLNKWGKVSNYDFAKKLKNPFLKEGFELLFEGEEFPILAITMQLVYYGLKCAGYPIGGSFALTNKIEEKYLELGGKITYNTKIKKIIVKDDVACGLLTENSESIACDIVISAADWHYTVFEALEGKYVDKTIISLSKEEKLKVFDSAILISLGVNNRFEEYPHLYRFPIEEIKTDDGTNINRIETHIYHYDKTMAPDGKTIVSVTLPIKNAQYWIDLRNSDYETYKDKKEKIAKTVIEILNHKFGNIKDNIEVMDVATPATFNRYTGNWKGSIQGWLPSKQLFAPSPVKNTLPGLENFYLVGQWLAPGGGLPIALLTGRNTAQVICEKDNKDFKNN